MARKEQPALANVRFQEEDADWSKEESNGGYAVPLVSAALNNGNEATGEPRIPGHIERKEFLHNREESVPENYAGYGFASNHQAQSSTVDDDFVTTPSAKRRKTDDNMENLNATDHGSPAQDEAGKNLSIGIPPAPVATTTPLEDAQFTNPHFEKYVHMSQSGSANSGFLRNVGQQPASNNPSANSQYLHSKQDTSGEQSRFYNRNAPPANVQYLLGPQGKPPLDGKAPPGYMAHLSQSFSANSQFVNQLRPSGIQDTRHQEQLQAMYLLQQAAQQQDQAANLQFVNQLRPSRTQDTQLQRGLQNVYPPQQQQQQSTANSQFVKELRISPRQDTQHQEELEPDLFSQQMPANVEFLGRLPAPSTQYAPPPPPPPQQMPANTEFLGGLSVSRNRTHSTRQSNAANTQFLGGVDPHPYNPGTYEPQFDQFNLANTQFLKQRDLDETQRPFQPKHAYDSFKQQTTQYPTTQYPTTQYPTTQYPPPRVPSVEKTTFGSYDVDGLASANVMMINGLRSRRVIESGLHLQPRQESTSSDDEAIRVFYPTIRGHANANQDAFPYEPLPKGSPNSIRLLSFEMPSSAHMEETDDLHCTVTVRNPWEEPATYHCLSYCWGGEQKTHNIHIKTSQTGSNYSIPITKNLHRALKQVTQSQGVQRLWVDALCINQSDAIERSAQVAMMKQIYSKAAGVVIWLGEGETAQFAQTCTKAIHAMCQRFTEATGVPSSSITGPQGLTLNLAQLDELKRDAEREPVAYYYYKQISRFFSVPWFRRVWVLQEAFSNTTVEAWFGSHHLHWGQIILAALWHSFLIRDYISKSDVEEQNDTQGDIGYLPELWLGLVHNRVPRGLSMIELVCRARDFQATDPRDKVFALLGLANDSPNVRPDYTKSKMQVYTDFAKSIISQTGNLDVLSAVDTFTLRSEPRSSPSWMPDLDVSIATIRGLGFPRKYNAAFSTTATILPTATDSDSNTENSSPILSLTGFEIDTLTSTISPLLSLTKDLTLYIGNSPTAITTLWQSYIRCHPQFDVQDSSATLKAFVRTLTATGFALPTSFPAHPLGTVVPPEQAPSLESDFLAYYTRTDPTLSVLKDVPHFGNEEFVKMLAERGDADQFAVLAGKACDERLFFISEAGRLGLCPREAREGDRVVVLYGGSVPYVLRPLDDGKWMFVGECYVDGIMFGEAEALKSQKEIEDRVFNVR